MELESEVRLSGQDSVLLPEMGVSGGQKEGRGIQGLITEWRCPAQPLVCPPLWPPSSRGPEAPDGAPAGKRPGWMH